MLLKIDNKETKLPELSSRNSKTLRHFMFLSFKNSLVCFFYYYPAQNLKKLKSLKNIQFCF